MLVVLWAPFSTGFRGSGFGGLVLWVLGSFGIGGLGVRALKERGFRVRVRGWVLGLGARRGG